MTVPCIRCGIPVLTTTWQVRRNKNGEVACSRKCRRPRACRVEGCGKPNEARELCRYHYNLEPDVMFKRVKYRKPYSNNYIRSSVGRYGQLKRAAKDKNLGFDITEEEHAALLLMSCHYCKYKLNPTGHSLDRKDNSKGYVKDNVVPCCTPCNRIKNRYLSHDEMVVAMAAVNAHRSVNERVYFERKN